MTERAYIPGSAACGQWETLLTDALDGLLRPEDEASFAAHMASCPACQAMFDEARKGREWLEFLAPEPEVPAGLLAKILAETGPGKAIGPRLAGAAGVVLPLQPAWHRPGLMGFVRRFAEPRLMMTAAMAFFSIALTLNLTGVRLADVKLSDLRPTAVRSYMERRWTTASTPIVRYYDHLRLAYEVESRMRELRRTTGVGEQPDTEKKNETPSAPGESKQTPGHKSQRQSFDLPLQSANVLPYEMKATMKTSLNVTSEPLRSGGSWTSEQERSTRWIA
jgi:hypothetical protein